MKRTRLLGSILAPLLFAHTACGQTQAEPQFVPGPWKSVDWRKSANDVRALDHITTCRNHYQDYSGNSVSLGGFTGGKVKSVRITDVVEQYLLNQATPLEIIRKVWTGRFSSAECFINWDEGNFWTVEATVKFEDGTEAKLITDGGHVAFQDHAGKSWFVRLLPAAQ